MIILGVDPGSIVCGFGVISSDKGNISLIEYGVIEAAKREPDFYQRLKVIYSRLVNVINRTHPEVSVFETMFYSKNAQSLIKLTHARSSAILSALISNLEIAEYSPREVKRAVTGNGNASKDQVQFMVKKLLNIDETPDFYDSTDALAVAICHSMRNSFGNSNSGSSWSDFVKNNPDKVLTPNTKTNKS